MSPYGRNIDSMIDVENLADGVATNVTYIFKNVHDKMYITNITLFDTFTKDFKFDVIHREERNYTWTMETSAPDPHALRLIGKVDK